MIPEKVKKEQQQILKNLLFTHFEKDDDLRIPLDIDGLGDAAGAARVIDVAGEITAERGGNRPAGTVVNVAGRVVVLLPALGQLCMDHHGSLCPTYPRR